MPEAPAARKRPARPRATPAPEGGSEAPPTPPPAKAAPGKRPRRVAAGDIGPTGSQAAIERHAVDENVTGATVAQLEAFADILAGRSPQDAAALLRQMLREQEQAAEKLAASPDDELADDWRSGGYPYRNLMARKNYERQKYRLQVELLKLQAWVKETGQKVVILFEGRDAAGKGGHDQAVHGAPQPARRPGRGAGEADRARARPVVLPALRRAPADRGRDRAVRPVLVQPRRRRAGDGLLHRSGSTSSSCARRPSSSACWSATASTSIKFWFSVSRAEQRRRFKERKVAPAEAVEALADRPRVARQVGRLHQGQGGDVLLHRHRRRAVDGDQVRLQEAGAAQRDALRAAHAAVLRTRTSTASARSIPLIVGRAQRRLRARREGERAAALNAATTTAAARPLPNEGTAPAGQRPRRRTR